MHWCDTWITWARASLGAFEKYTVESAVSVLDGMKESLSMTFSQVNDTDVALETTRLIRSQIFANVSVSSLLLAGQSHGRVGSLLGGL